MSSPPQMQGKCLVSPVRFEGMQRYETLEIPKEPMMFIGKFSDKAQKNMLAGKTTSPKEQLEEGSLIKWENKNNSRILRMARELIWVAYNSEKNGASWCTTVLASSFAFFPLLSFLMNSIFVLLCDNCSMPILS